MVSSKHQSKRGRGNGPSLEMAQFIDAGSNKIKKRIRDLERLLTRKRATLPDTIIIEKERTLEALKHELENAKLRQTVKENAKKYHMVRFFERKKALRRYKKAVKLTDNSDKESAAGTDLLEKTIDLCYVVNFPKTEKYIALYPSNENEEEKLDKGSKKTQIRREAFRELIATQLKEGTLPVSLKEISRGKKLNKDGTGVALEEENSAKEKTETIEKHEVSSGEDEFFE